NPATHAYRINSPYSNEYFIVEYRINTGDWIDTYKTPQYTTPADTIGLGIPESGLVIYRVNESTSGNYTGNFELYTYRPNGTNDTNGNLYCAQYASGITSQYNFETTRIDRDTNPTLFLTNGKYGGLTINNIGSAGPTITFDVTINKLSNEVYVRPGFGNDPLYPDHYETIQEALDECGNEGTVYIYPGIYTGEGNREIRLKNLHNVNNVTFTRMEEENGPVILDCGGFMGFGLFLNNGNCVISNIEIVNASTAISISQGSSTIDNVIFHGQDNPTVSNTGISVTANQDSSEVIIRNCRFIGGYYVWIINSSSKRVTLQNNNFEDITAYLNNVEFPHGVTKLIEIKVENLVMENNVFQNIFGDKYNAIVNIECSDPLTDTSNISIVKNQFIDNKVLVDEDSSDPVVNISLQKVQNCPSIMIKENIFVLYSEAIPTPCTNISIQGLSSPTSFVSYYNNTEIGFGENDGTSIRLSAQGAFTTIKNSIFTGKVKSALLGGPTVITNSWIFNNRLPETILDLDEYLINIDTVNQRDIYTGNPHLDMTTYTPIWEPLVKSGLINAGNWDTNANGIGFWDDPEDQKLDGTNLDIGAVQSGLINGFKQNLIRHDFSNESDFLWLSFPYLDRYYHDPDTADFYPHLLLSYVLGKHNDNNLFSLNPRFIDYIEWNYNRETGSIYFDSLTGTWAGDLDHQVDSRYGYKIKKDPLTMYPRPIITNGFHSAANNNLSNLITLQPREPGTYAREIWLGYYGNLQNDPRVIFLPFMEKLIYIKTQYWSISRLKLGMPFGISGTPLLNVGDMVSLGYADDDSFSFMWLTAYLAPHLPFYTHPRTIEYTFREEADYIAIYVTLPDVIGIKEYGEIGLFIDGVCYGAAVIMDEITQINAYILDLDLDSVDISFQIYEYNTRSEPLVVTDYSVFNEKTQLYDLKTLDLKSKEPCYFVSLIDFIPTADDLPLTTSLENNYPNPFNPATTINYNLKDPSNVKLQIFNIKGQLIQTLVSEYQPAGRYKVVWNGEDNLNKSVASGLYFYRLRTDDVTAVKKMMLLK
ncbi:MAG: T9SS type A sorting domain-containing protein, partial [Candidatus Cloacimonetes bacterium]|nr:T9SS type A sorting domain-containing protein [Candidatus Cloacimonadota bacterium]